MSLQRSFDRGITLAMRAARHDWAADPRVPAAFLAMIHDTGGVLPIQLDDVAGHFETCDMTRVVRVYPAETCDDGDGCRLTRLRAVVHCPHEDGAVDHTEYGDLSRLLEWIEERDDA